MSDAVSFTLTFGRLNILISCENPNFGLRLKSSYKKFIGRPGNENASISLKLIDQPISNPWDDPAMIWSKNGLVLEEAAYSGSIENSPFKAELQLSRLYSLQKVDHFIRIATALWVFQMGGIFIHAAALKRKGVGYVFTGHSGKGKTTVCRISQPAKVLNDDLVIIERGRTGWLVCSTPFTNPSQVSPNPGCANLDKIFQLNQARQNAIKMEKPAKAFADLITHVPVIPGSPERLNDLMVRCRNLVDEIQIYNLYFLPDDSFWQMINSL